MMNNNDIRVTTPEILWHGGGLLPGKPDPVLSIDMYSEDILVTSGIDANIPPKGSIRVRFIPFDVIMTIFCNFLLSFYLFLTVMEIWFQ